MAVLKKKSDNCAENFLLLANVKESSKNHKDLDAINFLFKLKHTEKNQTEWQTFLCDLQESSKTDKDQEVLKNFLCMTYYNER